MLLSERLQELRKKNKDSQEQLADKLGLSRQAVSKWENGQGSPDINNIVKISETYEVSTDYILKGIPPATPSEKSRKCMDATLKKALIVLLVIAGISLVAVFFLTALVFFTRLISHT